GRRDVSFGQNIESNRTLLPNIVRDIKNVAGFFQFTMRTGDIDIILESLSIQGKVNVISSPKISALNNQTAIIKVGTQRTFFTISTTLVPSGATTITQETVETRDITTGVTLDVTPQISPDGFITMNIHPSVTDQVGSTFSRNGDEAPILDIRETDTVIRVKDGETIVMGGLTQDKKNLNENQTPILGKVPVLGHLFKEVNNEKRKVDLVIFLTPTILVGDRVEDMSNEELQRLRFSEKR
ncbi:MAG: type II secretion system protein GspD, partial [Candidatus Brocadiales bacterium]